MVGEGVHKVYLERAKKGGDILWHVTIKGRDELAPKIPLHMSLKVFEDKKDMDVEELKRKVEEFKIKTPDPKKLKFKTTIFTSERDGKKYYMLLVEGVDKEYKEFYNSLKHCGTTYKEFMPHVTIDKELYEQINEEGLKPEEVEFQELTIEAGAGNTVHEFDSMEKSEKFALYKETILMNLDLIQKHGKSISLSLNFFENYIKDNQGLEEQIIKKHESRVQHHFGTNKEIVDFALKNGIKKAYSLLGKK